MPTFTKINYIDLVLEALEGRIQKPVGRDDDYSRLNQILNRSLVHHVLVTGPHGIGKTAFVRGLATRMSSDERRHVNVVMLNTETLTTHGGGAFYEEALSHIPPHTLVLLDDFGLCVFQKPATLELMTKILNPLLNHNSIRLIACASEAETAWMQAQLPQLPRLFEMLKLEVQPEQELRVILDLAVALQPDMSVMPEALKKLLSYQSRFDKLGAAPGGSLRLLDDSISMTRLHQQTVITPSVVDHVTASRLRIPVNRLTQTSTGRIKHATDKLTSLIVGQEQALATIGNIITRAELGLKNAERPRASFLMLGPSGVGKTETAKVLADGLFGNQQHFIRFDMSEFSEGHTTQRLIGSPPGYVGYDAGGELTSKLQQDSNCLVLLDEIEKAHGKIFDLFLHVLDNGRITSAQGEMIDCRDAIFYATSNCANGLISAAWEQGELDDPQFMQSTIFPELMKYFRTEFLNRFDAIIIFKPLGENDLLAVAKLEIKKILDRSRHKVSFSIDDSVLKQQIASRLIPGLGARPIKRFIEETCESLIAQHIMNNNA